MLWTLVYKYLFKSLIEILLGIHSILSGAFLEFHFYLFIMFLVYHFIVFNCYSRYTVCVYIYIYQFSSGAQSCLTLWNPMDYSTPGFAVIHHLTEFAQMHVHSFGDAIQPSHPMLPTSHPALNLHLCLHPLKISGLQWEPNTLKHAAGPSRRWPSAFCGRFARPQFQNHVWKVLGKQDYREAGPWVLG